MNNLQFNISCSVQRIRVLEAAAMPSLREALPTAVNYAFFICLILCFFESFTPVITAGAGKWQRAVKGWSTKEGWFILKNNRSYLGYQCL
ncbi:hypothetical protein ACEYW6_13050 [Nostoc sp. UIC 10607]|uniref:hypothetical protein n=1 Tax=Nostoc sp. UIC 10607 TaxID=3045935 RepID=UPI0039A363AA